MILTYTPHERLWLKNHPDFTERWLQTCIAENPAILGLGDLVLIQRERIQERAGRLDLLLGDEEGSQRFEVELMLGPTDESHIIRTIEYWDIERRRYPGYDHTAVIVAEDVTSRFLNVLALLSGTIPLVAVQMNAIRIDDRMLLNFVTILDQRSLRRDDEDEVVSQSADRAYWERRSSPNAMQMADQILALINSHSETCYQLNYNRGYIGLFDGRRSRNFVLLQPRRHHLRFLVRLTDASQLVEQCDEAGLSADVSNSGRLRLSLSADDLQRHQGLIQEIAAQAVRDLET